MKSYLPLAIGYLLPSIVTEDMMEGSKKPLTCHRLILFILLGMLLLGGCTSASSGESAVMRELRKSDQLFTNSESVRASYFFYPSTMRMVNIDNMPNWNEAIQDVRRLSILSMWPDRFDPIKVAEDLKEKENFSLYAELEDRYSNFKLLGRENGAEAVLMLNDSTTSYVFHLLGKVNYVKLMKLSADLREKESKGTGISFLMKALGQDEERSARQRHYYDRKREIEAAEKLRKDSIEAALQGAETAITE